MKNCHNCQLSIDGTTYMRGKLSFCEMCFKITAALARLTLYGGPT